MAEILIAATIIFGFVAIVVVVFGKGGAVGKTSAERGANLPRR